MLISSSGDSNFNKSKIYSECRISITNIILNTNYWNSVGIKQWRFEPKWNYISLEWRISITTISLLYIHIIYAYIKQWRFEPKYNKVILEWRISITNIIFNIIIRNSIGIKQWRFELRTPLPKRGAQPLGHLPDKIWKIG